MRECSNEDIERVFEEVGCHHLLPLTQYTNFYEQGVIDSVQITEIVIRLEEVYEIEFETHELILDNFGTVKKIRDMVNKKLEKETGV